MNPNDKSADKPSSKKPYNRPVVHHYGTIEEMTQNVGKTGKRDGAIGANKKTQ
jgi:hypothetical protein